MMQGNCRIPLLSMFFTPELRARRGRMALPVVFWGHGLVISLARVILHGTALHAGQLAFQQVLILASPVCTVWILVAIRYCAANAGSFWGKMARWLTVTWGMNTDFVLLFLQIGLLLGSAGS